MRWFAAALLSALLVGNAPAVRGQPAELARAQELLRQGKSEEAWRLLAPLERRHAGQRDFDLALAMAATDSGRPNLATFALERVVVMHPGDASARLELARALYALRDYERAERELQFILEADPPPPVRALVARYRRNMHEMQAAATSPGRWSGYAEAGFGYDSNPNVATAQGSIFIPSLGTELLLGRGAVSESDNFAAAGAGLEYAHALSARWTVLAGGDAQARWHADLDTADWRSVDLRAGLRHEPGARDSLQYSLAHNEFALDHESYRRIRSASAEWSRRWSQRTRTTLFAQGYRIRELPQPVRANSSDVAAAGANGAYLPGGPAGSIVLGGVFLGYDNAIAGRADGDRRFYGASAALQRRLGARLDGYASLALLYSDYRRINPDFAVLRRDRQADLAAGLSWEMGGGWSLRPEVAYTRNRSNLVINDYRRTQASLILRRAWE
jgi:tetratricopeptide (TPR) repeat protein